MESKYYEVVNRVNQLEKHMEEKDTDIDKFIKKISFVLKNKKENIDKVMMNEKDNLLQIFKRKLMP